MARGWHGQLACPCCAAASEAPIGAPDNKLSGPPKGDLLRIEAKFSLSVRLRSRNQRPLPAAPGICGNHLAARASIMVRYREPAEGRGRADARERRNEEQEHGPTGSTVWNAPMATASGTPEAREPLTAQSGVHLVTYDKYIEGQLRKTRRQVRAVDLASAILILIAGTLGYLFTAALVDHWLVSGGMGYAGRTMAWVVFLSAGIGVDGLRTAAAGVPADQSGVMPRTRSNRAVRR